MRKKWMLSMLLSALLLFGAVGCGGGEAAEKGAFPGTPESDMITLNITSEPAELNPMKLKDTIAQSILYHCMSGLTRLDAKDEPIADLAESWEMNEDKTVYTIFLRQDAKWSNGDPVTAHDFYYSWVMQMTPSTGTTLVTSLTQNIKNGEAFYNGEVDASQLGIQVLDDYTLEIEWSRPMTNGLFFLAQPFFLPMNQKAYEEIGEEAYAKEAGSMVTNGAYQITEWVHDSYMVLEKNEAYYDAASVQIPKAKLMMIGDVNTNLNAFMAGEIDLCSLYSEQIAYLNEQGATDVIQYYVDGGSWYLGFNLQDPQISNLNLRKALAYGIDVQSLLDYVINDGSTAADGLVPSVIAGADGESYAESRGNLFGYDKEKAIEYLEAALAELGVAKEDLKLSFWGTDTTYNMNQAAYLQQQWKENLGLDVELISTTANALNDAKMSGNFSMAVNGTGPSENDAMTFLENFQSTNPNNYGKYNNPAYDQLLDEAIMESDTKKRQELMIAAEKMLIDDMVIGPMYFTCSAYGVSDKLEGLVRTPFQFFTFRDAEIQV